MDTKLLRQKILDLAIRGKLVPQDPNDEPASVLLERIIAEKERLINEGKIKRSKKTATTSDSRHYPFEVPESWEWCIVDDFAYVASGSTPSKDSFVEKGVPYIKMYNLRNQKIDFNFHPQYITREVHEGKLQRSKTEVGDLIMNIVGPPLGKLAIIPPSLPESNFNQAAVLIRPYFYKDVLVKYLFYYLSEMSEINSISTKGSAGQVNISLTQSQNMRIALPPLEEQKRIISTVENLFQIVDIIDNGSIDISMAISKVKAQILDLAIHGKLVSQDPSDEPASELLKRVNPSAEITCDNEQYWNMPRGWVICNFNQIFKTVSSKQFQIQQSEILTTGKTPVVSQSSLFIEGYSNETNICKYHPSIIFGDHTRNVKYIDFEFIVGADGVKILMPEFNPKYAYYLIKYATLNIENKGYSRHFGQISKFKFPLPPLAEQQRIVAKIEELFAQLDAIENSLQA